MSTLATVIASIRGVLDKAAWVRQTLTHAAHLLDEGHERLGDALTGSHDPDAQQALVLLAKARAGIDAAYHTVAEAENRAQSYLNRLGGVAASTKPPLDRIEQLRRELPSPVVARSGQKTHGRWIDAAGHEHAEVSGKDQKYDDAIRFFKEMKVSRIPSRAPDVEMKLAVYMRRNGIRSATLVINHLPCEGQLGCDALVPVILPEGYTLTVYGVNGFVREYRGGKTSSWLP